MTLMRTETIKSKGREEDQERKTLNIMDQRFLGSEADLRKSMQRRKED